jgi:hypothetical protein
MSSNVIIIADPEFDPLSDALEEVFGERERQEAKWGPQNHENGTGAPEQIVAADRARQRCEEAFSVGLGTWADILAEEFFEVMGATDDERLRAELIQVAAVAVAWVEAIDRRAQRGTLDA